MLRLARRLPEFGVPPRPVGLAALYDASDDWVPIYDRSSLDGLLHGLRDERQPVQERAAGRAVHPRRSSTPPTPASTTTRSPCSSPAR